MNAMQISNSAALKKKHESINYDNVSDFVIIQRHTYSPLGIILKDMHKKTAPMVYVRVKSHYLVKRIS